MISVVFQIVMLLVYTHIRIKQDLRRLFKEIQIAINDKLMEEQHISVLLHEISRCLCDHIEKKVKNNWIICDHSNAFYDKYWGVFEYAIISDIIKIKHSVLKHI